MLLGRLAMGGALLATKDRERHPMPVTAKGTVSDLVAEQRQ